MGKLLLLISIVLAASAAIVFPGLVSRSRFERLVSFLKRIGLTGCSEFAEAYDCFELRALAGLRRLSRLIGRLNFRNLINRFRLSDLSGGFGSDDFAGLSGFSSVISRIKSRILHRAGPGRGTEFFKPLDMDALNCRVQLARQQEDNGADVFKVEICGSIRAPSGQPEGGCITLRISILDVTDGEAGAEPVQARVNQWSAPGGAESSAFRYDAGLGKLPRRVTTLSDWTAVARLRIDWLAFPRKGRRELQFSTSVLSADSGQELALAKCHLSYENPAFGYMEMQQNIERSKILAVALAFAVSAADGRLYECEVELIRKWAIDNILGDSERASDKACHELDRALDKTIEFFLEGYRLNPYEICSELVEIVPIGQRYDVLDLCLHAAKANGSVVAEELALLKNLATWLEVDAERFRVMTEKVLPIHMHKVKDVEAVLGITSDMSKEKTRQKLNKEYSKWNSRVTNSDPNIQSQADQMLKLIAEARSECVAEKPHLAKK